MCDIVKINKNVKYEIYINSFRDEERDQSMIRRINEVGVQANLYSYKEDDDRARQISLTNLKIYGNFYSMMRIIEDFYYKSDKEYAVILENDVYLKKTLAFDLQKACDAHSFLNLDVLLIGYLLPCSPDQLNLPKITTINGYHFYSYPDDLWGSHGFIINKKHALYFINKYTIDYVKTLETVGADWIFTKEGKRALMWPPIVVEEGTVKTDHYGQIKFHYDCKQFLYNDNYTL